jgi:hypothetical protein
MPMHVEKLQYPQSEFRVVVGKNLHFTTTRNTTIQYFRKNEERIVRRTIIVISLTRSRTLKEQQKNVLSMKKSLEAYLRRNRTLNTSTSIGLNK